MDSRIIRNSGAPTHSVLLVRLQTPKVNQIGIIYLKRMPKRVLFMTFH